MRKLSAEAVAEIACGAPSWNAVEHEVTSLVLAEIGGETAFFGFDDTLGAHPKGAVESLGREIREQWAAIHNQSEQLMKTALSRGGVVVDSELLGSDLERVLYYQLMMRPVHGRSTLIGAVAAGDRVLAKLAVGRCWGSSAFREREAQQLRAVLPTLALALQVHQLSGPASPAPSSLARINQRAYDSLSRREREVLDYVRLGYSNAQIGIALGTRPRTVRNQLSEVYRKLGVANRAEAVAIAFGLRAQP